MASWSDFEAEAPELAARVRELLDAHGHKTIATIRRDGSPRISGTETELSDGELWIGSMQDALKARDLQRDPRFALHSASEDPDVWTGDAKLAESVITGAMATYGVVLRPFDLAVWAIPTAIVAFLIHGARLFRLDRSLGKRGR